MSERGQKAKYSRRADVFCFASANGHRSIESACSFGANSGSRPYSRQQGREARAAFAINYDGNPDQDGRPAGPALQVLRLQSWYTPRHSKDGICFKDRQSRYRARQLFMHCCLAVSATAKMGELRSASRALSVPVLNDRRVRRRQQTTACYISWPGPFRSKLRRVWCDVAVLH